MRSTPGREVARRAILKWSILGAPALLAVGTAFACAAPPRVHVMSVSRDAGCGCCHGWTTLMQRSGRFETTLHDVADMPALKQRLGVPGDLVSCHTAEVDGYVIEGHVPAQDIVRLLNERPSGVRGLAVAGMPRGSPGMEQPGGAIDPFVVFAFRSGGARTLFSRHG